MSLSDDFKSFCKNIKQNNLDDMKKTAETIAQKLNKNYYNTEADTQSHMYIVGSVGRRTSITGVSDLDLIFDLPLEVYNKFDSYESNGQSALLQEIKNVLIKRYPNTDINGDGQVVVINFNKYTVELVPGFKQSNNKFKYPDTHDGGSWKITDPLKEQDECALCDSVSEGIYFDFCHIVRSWKNNIGFEFGGLLIDSLVYNFFIENEYFSTYDDKDYLKILILLFNFLRNENPKQSYWLAVGSNQQVRNSNNGKFVSKAKKAYDKLKGKKHTSEDINDILIELLGNNFPKIEKNLCETVINSRKNSANDTEEFIEQLVQVDIRYYLNIDCKVTQNGWRPFLLGEFDGLLKHNKQLDFFIKETDCPQPYKIWWKVRNVGAEAERRKMFRGSIIQRNSDHHHEHTDFEGPHYVECYLIKNGTCVARAKINVPIGSC